MKIRFLVPMRQDLINRDGVLNARDNTNRATAAGTGLNIDAEYAFERLSL